jgi:fluoroacetyl-CoA thioesterase
MKEIKVGINHTSKVLVTSQNTALNMGSGDMMVLATPEMVALMENAAMSCVSSYLENDETTVGCSINTTHIRPSAIGTTVLALATLIQIENRKLTFHVVAKDANDNIIGEGTHERVIVNRERFLSKMK